MKHIPYQVYTKTVYIVKSRSKPFLKPTSIKQAMRVKLLKKTTAVEIVSKSGRPPFYVSDVI